MRRRFAGLRRLLSSGGLGGGGSPDTCGMTSFAPSGVLNTHGASLSRASPPAPAAALAGLPGAARGAKHCSHSAAAEAASRPGSAAAGPVLRSRSTESAAAQRRGATYAHVLRSGAGAARCGGAGAADARAGRPASSLRAAAAEFVPAVASVRGGLRVGVWHPGCAPLLT